MRIIVVALVALAFTATTHAQDWPQWLGPERNGAIPVKIAPWKGTLEVAWKVPVGEGHSSPIVANGRVYLHSKAAGLDEEVLTCWDLAGKQLWESSYPRGAFTPRFGAGPRATPCVADGKLYSLGVTGFLICWDATSGKQHWKVNLLEQFGAKNLFFGISSSPMVVGKYVYVMPGGAKASVVALDKETGAVAWQAGSDAATYASPMVITFGDKQVLVFLTREGLVGLDDKTGKEYFRVPLKDSLNESSTTPVRVGDLLIASSVTFGSLAARIGSLEGQPVATQEWKEAKLTCYFGTPVEFDGLLYLVTGRIINPAATLYCLDPKTGKVLWTKSGVGKYHATLLRTKDKVLMLEEGGELVMLDPNEKEYKELARAKVCGNTWAHPGWANGLFVIRDDKELKAVKLSAE